MDSKLAAEYRDVALRAEHLDHSGRSAEEVLRLISIVEAVAEPVLVIFKPRPLSIDPDDDMILDLAINGLADLIVSQNIKHLKSQRCVMDRGGKAAPEFEDKLPSMYRTVRATHKTG